MANPQSIEVVARDEQKAARGRRLGFPTKAFGLLIATTLVGFGIAAAAVRSPKTSAANTIKTVRDVPRLNAGAVEYSESFAQRAGIRLHEVRRTVLTPTVRVVGTVTFDPAYQATVGSRVRGLVRRVLAVEGSSIRAGDALAEVESAELADAQAALKAAQARTLATEAQAARQSELARESLTTAREVEVSRAELAQGRAELQAAKQRVSALGGQGGGFGLRLLRAPISGILVERLVSVGQTIEASSVAFKIADLDHLWVDLAVFERDIGWVRDGDPVDLRPMSDDPTVIAGRVAHVGRIIHAATRTADVRIAVNNPSEALRPGQSVTATIRTTRQQQEALCVPVSAVTRVDGKAIVFVAPATTRVVPTAVELGLSDGIVQEVRSGLQEGQQVVAEGVFAIKSELYR